MSESLPGYDAWKTRDPREDEPERDECEHGLRRDEHCPDCDGPPEAAIPVNGSYEVILEKSACPHCGRGESWTVKGPDDVLIGQSWEGPEGECEADETSQMLNAAYELGKKHQ